MLFQYSLNLYKDSLKIKYFLAASYIYIYKRGKKEQSYVQRDESENNLKMYNIHNHNSLICTTKKRWPIFCYYLLISDFETKLSRGCCEIQLNGALFYIYIYRKRKIVYKYKSSLTPIR